MKRIIMLVASVALLFVTTMAPANAGLMRDPNPTFVDGSINVVAGKGTGNAVYISRDRCCSGQPLGPYAWVYPGNSSKSYWPDTDAFYLASGFDLVYGWHASWGWQESGRWTATGWHNLNDARYVWYVRD